MEIKLKNSQPLNPFQRNVWFTFYLSVCLIFLGCQKGDSETREELAVRVRQAVAEKLEQQRIKKMQKCKANAIAIAERRVDSILLAEAKQLKIDTLNRPIKPIKPDRPEILIPKDSADIEPLFDLNPDSLTNQ